jgi:hypothetical protein
MQPAGLKAVERARQDGQGDAVRCSFRRGYASGIWETRATWSEIEKAINHGWEWAGETACAPEAKP